MSSMMLQWLKLVGVAVEISNRMTKALVALVDWEWRAINGKGRCGSRHREKKSAMQCRQLLACSLVKSRCVRIKKSVYYGDLLDNEEFQFPSSEEPRFLTEFLFPLSMKMSKFLFWNWTYFIASPSRRSVFLWLITNFQQVPYFPISDDFVWFSQFFVLFRCDWIWFLFSHWFAIKK